MSGEAWMSIFLFLIGAAGFAGLFMSWPLILCIILIALGWGTLIVVVNSDGSSHHGGGGWDFDW